MVKKLPIICEGVEFPSVTAMCAHYGVERYKTHSRILRGWTPEQAIGLVEKEQSLYRPKSVCVDGIEYPTMTEAALALGVKLATVKARIERDYSIEDAFLGLLKPRIGKSVKSIKFRGETFRSQTDLASKFGVSGGLMAKRIKSGWTIEQALEIEPPPPRFRNFDGHAREQKWKDVRLVDGKVEPIPDIGGYKLYLVTNNVNSKVYVGLTIGPIESRLKQHFAAARKGIKSAFCNAIRKYGEGAFQIELLSTDAKTYDELQEQEILEIRKRDAIRNGYNTALGGSIGTSKSIVIAGKTHVSYAAAAEEYGVNPVVFSTRISKLKWTPEEAAGLVDKDWAGKEKSVLLGGVQYPSMKAAAEALEVNYKLAHERYKSKGWTLEQSFGLEEPPGSHIYAGAELTVFGVTYPSIAEASRALGVNSTSFQRRILDGATPEESFNRARKKPTNL